MGLSVTVRGKLFDQRGGPILGGLGDWAVGVGVFIEGSAPVFTETPGGLTVSWSADTPEAEAVRSIYGEVERAIEIRGVKLSEETALALARGHIQSYWGGREDFSGEGELAAPWAPPEACGYPVKVEGILGRMVSYELTEEHTPDGIFTRAIFSVDSGAEVAPPPCAPILADGSGVIVNEDGSAISECPGDLPCAPAQIIEVATVPGPPPPADASSYEVQFAVDVYRARVGLGAMFAFGMFEPIGAWASPVANNWYASGQPDPQRLTDLAFDWPNYLSTSYYPKYSYAWRASEFPGNSDPRPSITIEWPEERHFDAVLVGEALNWSPSSIWRYYPDEITVYADGFMVGRWSSSTHDRTPTGAIVPTPNARGKRITLVFRKNSWRAEDFADWLFIANIIPIRTTIPNLLKDVRPDGGWRLYEFSHLPAPPNDSEDESICQRLLNDLDVSIVSFSDREAKSLRWPSDQGDTNPAASGYPRPQEVERAIAERYGNGFGGEIYETRIILKFPSPITIRGLFFPSYLPPISPARNLGRHAPLIVSAEYAIGNGRWNYLGLWEAPRGPTNWMQRPSTPGFKIVSPAEFAADRILVRLIRDGYTEDMYISDIIMLR